MIAAIFLPVVLGVIAIGGVVGVVAWFWPRAEEKYVDPFETKGISQENFNASKTFAIAGQRVDWSKVKRSQPQKLPLPWYARPACAWILSYIALVGKHVAPLPIVQKGRKLVAESAESLKKQVESFYGQGSKIAGPIGGAVGAAVGAIVGSILNLEAEQKLKEQRQVLARAMIEFLKAFGPPPSALVVYGISQDIPQPSPSESDTWHLHLLNLFASINQNFDLQSANLQPYKRPPRRLADLTADLNPHVISSGSFQEYDPPSRIPPWYSQCLSAELLFSYMTIPRLGQESKFYEALRQRLQGRSKDLAFSCVQADFEAVIKSAGWADPYPPASVIFTIGYDPASIEDIDLVDLLDFLPKMGGSISTRPDNWQARISCPTYKDANWICSHH